MVSLTDDQWPSLSLALSLVESIGEGVVRRETE